MKKSKVLITGGNGFIGSYLVEELISKGYKVRCLVRKNSRLDYIKKHLDKKKIELAFGDITDKNSLDKALKNIDIVYHMAAIAGKQNISEEEYWRVNYQGTVDLANLSAKHKVKKFIYCSSVGVMGNIEKIPADENSPYNPTNTYEKTKMEAEKYILKLVKERRFPAVIIRPAIVYGPRNISNMTRMFKAIKEGGWKFFVVGSGNNYWHMTYVSDVARGFILADKSPKAIGEIFIIAGKKPVTMNELTTTTAQILKVNRPKRLPYWLAMSAAYCFLIPKKIFNIKVPIEPSGVKFLTNHRAYSIKKAEKILGYKPHIDLQTGLQKTLDWYQENGYL